MKHRTWQDNADEFAALDQGEGWPFARLIACSVHKGTNTGGDRRSDQRSNRNADPSGKVSATEFAARADTSPARVLRYLEAWDKAAIKGWVPAADHLVPDSVTGMTDPEQNWRDVYDARGAGGRPRDSRPSDAATIISRRGAAAVVGAMTADQQAEMAKELAATNVQAVAEAITSTNEGLDAVYEANSNRPETMRETQHRERFRKEREAAEGEEVYHLRGFKVLPVLWDAEGLAEFIETKVVRTAEDEEFAKNAGLWMQSIGRRIVAWADGDTMPLSEEDFAREIESLLGEPR